MAQWKRIGFQSQRSGVRIPLRSFCVVAWYNRVAALAQLGERQTEDLKVPGSIPGGGTPFGSQSLSVALGSMLPIGFT